MWGRLMGTRALKGVPTVSPCKLSVFCCHTCKSLFGGEKSRITLVTHSTSIEDFGFHLLNYNLVFSLSIMSPSMIYVNSFVIVRRFKFHSIVPFVHCLPSSAIYRPLIMNK